MTVWNPLNYLRAHPAEWRQALRVVIAVATTLIAIALLEVPQGYWAVITAVIVVQTSIGGSLKAALDRLWGTLAGAAVGALVAILLPHSSALEIALAIIVAVVPLAYLAAVNPAFRVAPVTAVIMLVPTYGPHAGAPVATALDRVFEIALGNVIALAVSIFVFPARAQEQLRAAAAKVVATNAELMDVLVEGLLAGTGRQGAQPIHARIRAGIKQAEAAAEEASREKRMRFSDTSDPEPVVRTLYRVRHDLVMIGRAAAKPLPQALLPMLSTPLEDVKKATISTLNAIAATLSDDTPPPAIDAYQAALRSYVLALDQCAHAGIPEATTEAERLFTLRFALEQLGDDLRDLAKRSAEAVQRPSQSPPPLWGGVRVGAPYSAMREPSLCAAACAPGSIPTGPRRSPGSPCVHKSPRHADRNRGRSVSPLFRVHALRVRPTANARCLRPAVPARHRADRPLTHHRLPARGPQIPRPALQILPPRTCAWQSRLA
ncbi:MAG: FUSC family protein [Hyphomicrobiales bacterium]